MKILSRWQRELRAYISTVPKTVVAAAASAAGTGLVASVPFAFTWAMNSFAADNLIGILSEPAPPAASTTNAVGASCGQLPAVIEPSQFDRPVQVVEIWKARFSGTNLYATVSSEDGYGHGEIVGFQKLRNGAGAVDTISAAFSGKTVGRGVYYLERGYQDGGRNHWWRGTHTFFDCERALTLTCRFILGPASLRSAMSKDPWLQGKCSVEMLASNEVRTQRSTAN